MCGGMLVLETIARDVDPKIRTGWFFTYAACAMVMSLLACASVRCSRGAVVGYRESRYIRIAQPRTDIA